MFYSILILSAILICLLQIGFWLFIAKALGLNKRVLRNEDLPGISIVICSNNARALLESNLPAFVQQQYPEFELIVIDDQSTDGSLIFLEAFSKNNPKMNYFSNVAAHSGKKEALILGIQSARYEWIALSDVDCKPATIHWLKAMAAVIDQQTDIVLGWAPFYQNSSVLNLLIRFESCLNAITMFSAALWSKAYTATGRNLLYRKSIFNRDVLRMSFPGGDDDLLVNAMADKKNVRICLNPDSFVISEAKSKFKDYFLQKWRHYGVSSEYNRSSKVALLTFNGSLIGSYGLSAILLYAGEPFMAIFYLLLHWIIRWPVFCKYCKPLKEQDLCLVFPLLEIAYVCQLILHIPFLFIKKKLW